MVKSFINSGIATIISTILLYFVTELINERHIFGVLLLLTAICAILLSFIFNRYGPFRSPIAVKDVGVSNKLQQVLMYLWMIIFWFSLIISPIAISDFIFLWSMGYLAAILGFSSVIGFIFSAFVFLIWFLVRRYYRT